MRDERERMDDMLMEITEVHCLHFSAPPECKPSDGYGTHYASKDAPGVYLRQEGHGKSPTAKPNNGLVRLTHDQARSVAIAIDTVAKPTSHGDGFFNRGGEVKYPGSYAEFVDAWYEALGRRLYRAIKSSEERLTSLRTTRAAITGVAD